MADPNRAALEAALDDAQHACSDEEWEAAQNRILALFDGGAQPCAPAAFAWRRKGREQFGGVCFPEFKQDDPNIEWFPLVHHPRPDAREAAVEETIWKVATHLHALARIRESHGAPSEAELLRGFAKELNNAIDLRTGGTSEGEGT